MVRTAALAFALLASTPAIAADQFDLLCEGTHRTIFGLESKSEPVAEHYRIDLKGKQWCQADCGAVHPIAEIQEAYLRLEASADGMSARGRTHFNWIIKRADGHETKSYWVDGSGLYSSETNASCKPAPFSGFPELKKQF